MTEKNTDKEQDNPFGGLVDKFKEMNPFDSDKPQLPERFQQPAGWEWNKITNKDGAKLRYGHLSANAKNGPSKGHIIIGPGAREMAEKYFETSRDFSDAGYDVWLLEWRGQGGSDRYGQFDIGLFDNRFDDHVRDLKQFVDETVKQRADGKPLFLLGHSAGGNIATRYLHDHGNDIKGAILSAPAVDFKFGVVPTMVVRLWFKLMNVMGLGGMKLPTFKKPKGDLTETFKQADEGEMRPFLHRMLFNLNPETWSERMNVKWVKELLDSSKKTAKPAFLRSIKTPVLVGIAGKDNVIFKEGVKAVAEHLPSAETFEIESAKHDLFVQNDESRTPWMNKCVSFLETHSDPSYKPPAIQ